MDLTVTRRSLHTVAEFVMAGPQYRSSGTIRLTVTPDGFSTVAEPRVSVVGADVVHGDLRAPIAGTSAAALAAALGLAAVRAEVYHDGSGVGPDEPLDADPAAAAYLAACFAAGDAALRRFAPDETPVLWPEHFDLGIAADEINYGISPGDAELPEPYAYVAPWAKREGAFWNASFGAALTLGEGPDVDAVVAFFAEGRAAAAG